MILENRKQKNLWFAVSYARKNTALKRKEVRRKRNAVNLDLNFVREEPVTRLILNHLLLVHLEEEEKRQTTGEIGYYGDAENNFSGQSNSHSESVIRTSPK